MNISSHSDEKSIVLSIVKLLNCFNFLIAKTEDDLYDKFSKDLVSEILNTAFGGVLTRTELVE